MSQSEEEPIIDGISGEEKGFSSSESAQEGADVDGKKSKPNLMTDLFGQSDSEPESDSFVDTVESRPQRADGGDESSQKDSDSEDKDVQASTPSAPLTQLQPEPEPVAQRTVLNGLTFPRPPEGSELPTSLELQPLVFDPFTYNGEDTKPEFEQDETGNRYLKRAHGDIMRWRYAQDGEKVVKESNARVVRWSDGSMHLFVGESSYEIQTPKYADSRDIFIRQKATETSESFLQYHGTLTKRMNLIPLDSNKGVKLSRTQLPSRKTARLMSRTTVDLEADKAQKEKIEQNMIELRRDMRATGPEMSKGFLEDDEDQEREAEKRIMRAKKGGRGGRAPGRGKGGGGGGGRFGGRKRERYEREVSNSEEEEDELDEDEEIDEGDFEDEEEEEEEMEEEEDEDEPKSKKHRR